MGECSVNSDIFDSLDYLILPVKKSQKTFESDLLISRNFEKKTDAELIKDFGKKISRIKSPFNSYESELHTSSLVALKKRTEELIQEQYSNLNYKNLKCFTNKYLEVKKDYRQNYSVKNKPMIEVTVIPKVTETQTSKVFNKRRKTPKKLQSTVSNQENSIKSQNIYLTVKGKRHEKVFEIKTTESTNLSKITKTKYEDISIQQISSSKRLINSLNMEKSKRKKNVQINKRDNRLDCTCHGIKNNDEILDPRKSKVTVFGQLGLTRDERYVLKCAATVNDKPITTNFVQIDNNESSNGTRTHRNAQQDSNVHTDICCANKSIFPDSNNTKYRMASQATQVNFYQVQNKKSKGFKTQVTQCSCSKAMIGNNVINSGAEENILKDCKSPLVVISVYPRHDKEDNINNSVKIIHRPDLPQNKALGNREYNILKPRKVNEKEMKVNTFPVKKTEQKSFRSRSPSPVSKTVPNNTIISRSNDKIFKKNNRINTSTRVLRINNASPDRSQNVNKSKQKLSFVTKDESSDCHYPQNLRNRKILKHPVNLKGGIKADSKEVKRALVNNFLKSVDRVDNKNLLAPKDTSRIAINIDGGKDRYDVLLEQRNFDTGLTVRKTFKNYCQTNSTEDEFDVNYMENFLMLSDEIKGANDAEIYSRESRDLSNIMLGESRLNVRDSLELRHSREDRVNSSLYPTHVRDKYDLRDTFLNTDLLAPVKHFRGDDCSIPDPNERDKEIRELLGIVRNKRKTKSGFPAGTKDSLPENKKEKGCCCRKKCSSKILMTELSISKFFTSKCIKRRNNKQRIINSSTQSKKYAPEEAKEGAIQASLHKKQETDVIKSQNVSNTPAKGSKDKEETKEISDSPAEELPKDVINKSLKGNNITTDKTEKQEKAVSLKQANIITEGIETEDTINSDEKAINIETVTFTGFPQNQPVVAPDTAEKESVTEQNLIMNRNIQVFLQVEQLIKQRPIILTQKQYDKVKRTIQCTKSKNSTVGQRKRCSLRSFNVVSVGEIKIKPRLQQFRYDQEVQTERSEIHRNVGCRQIHKCKTQTRKVRSSIKNKINHRKINKLISTTDTDMEFDRNVIEKQMKPNEVIALQTVSSMEVRYANVAYMKHVTVSSMQFGDGVQNTTNLHHSEKPSKSIHTLFKGPRKCVTPNLGTSAYSLCSDVTDACSLITSAKIPPCAGDSKPKKPFLQRLISCLVMRSAETSMLKEVPVRNLPSVNSSVDSYHISTSLGALEMTSSLYDTSASFYSNHTTRPINKMKRGFFSSVRVFLTTRRS